MRFLFQHAEETLPGGAEAMVERGAMDFVLEQYRRSWGWFLDPGLTTWPVSVPMTMRCTLTLSPPLTETSAAAAT